ncbi:hypothetical protein LNP26_23350 [Klebsiella variicola subsp. variicola]|nr:hypothetical protein [Klebsiella variicola subsp. variicola]
MVRQAGLLNTNTRYLFPVLEQYADSLLATFPRRAVECDIYLHRQREQRHRPCGWPALSVVGRGSSSPRVPITAIQRR